MGERTPTPWHVDGGFIRDAQGGILCVVPNNPENGKNWKNDAAFLVRTVNSHDALVKALEAVEFRGQQGKCPLCAGWMMSANGETPGKHTKDCLVGNALRASLPSPLEGG